MDLEYVLGIDPGFDGGFALFAPGTDPANPHHITAFNTPCIETTFMKTVKGKARKQKRREMNVDQVTTILRPYHIKYAYIEKVHAMPKQGGTGMFRFGENFGQWTGVLSGLGVTVDRRFYPTPQAWKKRYALHADKNTSRELAGDIFPTIFESFSRVKDDGIAEACLIAVYGAEQSGYTTTHLHALYG